MPPGWMAFLGWQFWLGTFLGYAGLTHFGFPMNADVQLSCTFLGVPTGE